jgi:hypothetical protein
MRSLINRVANLEGTGQSDLSPRVKAWLGWPLTDAERVELASAPPVDPAEIDTSNLSQEARLWLGVD